MQQQIKQIVKFLNGFLKIYVKQKEEELAEAKNTYSELERDKDAAEDEVANIKAQINAIEREIKDKTYLDADEITELYNPDSIVTNAEKEAYNNAQNRLAELENYLKTDESVWLIKEIAKNTPPLYPYPQSAVENIGRLEPKADKSIPQPQREQSTPPVLEKQKGCSPWSWIAGLVKGKNKEQNNDNRSLNPICPPQDIAKAVNALKTNVESIIVWWHQINNTIKENRERQEYIQNRLANYNELIPNHRKSRTLIELKRVNDFRINDIEHGRLVKSVLDIWFDATIELDKRMAQKDLIDTHVIVPLREKYNILRWDETHPFVNEVIDDDRAHEIIEHTYGQSKPFVQYVNIDSKAIVNKISDSFYFNHPNLLQDPTDFRNKYRLSSGTIVPRFDKDFENSLCAVQVLGIEECVNDIQDFKPKRKTPISAAPADPQFLSKRMEIIGDAQGPKEIARRIYDWICDNIQYDITKTIHDADTCWRSKKGVCQAYCELFCHIAGDRLITEVVIGKSKQTDGTIPETRHAWLFVYTNGYDGIFIDPTWGAGSIDDGRFVQSVDRDVWFDVAPAWMIFTHYPENEEWQKLDTKITEELFKKLPVKFPDKYQSAPDALSHALYTLSLTPVSPPTEDE